MKKLTIYAVATDGRDGTQCHTFTDKKERDRFLVDFWFHDDVKEEAMRIAMEHGFYSEELAEMREDEGNRNDPLDSYNTDEIEVPMQFRLTHPTLTIDAEQSLITEMLKQGNTVLAANGHPASHTTIEDLLAALVAIGKAEITGGFQTGSQPWDVRDFSELHDRADANCYALLCDDHWAWASDSETEEDEDANEWRVQARNDVATVVQDALNDWLVETLPLRKIAAEGIFTYHPDIRESVGEWTEHPKYPRSEWKYLIAEGDTQLGYWEWVSNRLNE